MRTPNRNISKKDLLGLSKCVFFWGKNKVVSLLILITYSGDFNAWSLYLSFFHLNNEIKGMVRWPLIPCLVTGPFLHSSVLLKNPSAFIYVGCIHQNNKDT